MTRCPLCGQDLPEGTLRCPRDGIQLGDAQDPLIGATLAGRYRILGRIARGGMSSVYLARHVLIERLGAIKILRRDLCDDPVQRDRFLREARAVNRINHENIVEIVDYGESEDGRVFLVMEYLPGESLQQRLQRGAIAPVRSLDIAAQIASGLARAHQMGVIHRDLKPDNVLLVQNDSDRDIVKVLDFGIAKILDQPSLTATDKIFGTPGYIAPEYAAGSAIDGRADLYSLGVVLYEMVTAALPFEAVFPGDLLLKHMLEPPIPPRERDPSLPVPIENLILQALEKDPIDRFRDAYHMLERIDEVRSELTGSIRAPTANHVSELPPTSDTIPTDFGVPALVPPPAEIGGGIRGAEAWTRYVDARTSDASARRTSEQRVRTIRGTLDRMRGVIVSMQQRAERIDQLKSRMLGLEARGRDFRATIGRAVDSLAGDLSLKARERDVIAAEREDLEHQRESARAEGDANRADALLWQIAASEEVLRESVVAVEDVEYQLRELSTQLERLNESLEADQNALLAKLDEELRQLAAEDAGLRILAGTLPD